MIHFRLIDSQIGVPPEELKAMLQQGWRCMSGVALFSGIATPGNPGQAKRVDVWYTSPDGPTVPQAVILGVLAKVADQGLDEHTLDVLTSAWFGAPYRELLKNIVIQEPGFVGAPGSEVVQ